MGVSRNTVRKYIEEGEPRARPRKPRVAPVREVAEPEARKILEEWKNRTTAKQRITASRLHEELRKGGIEVGITVVQEIVRRWRREKEEAFVPLTYRPGEVAQVDFFEVTVDVGDKRQKAWMFVMRLMYSGRDFAWIYSRCDQVSFLDGHVRAFGHFGGAPHRVVYDNLKAAVRKILRSGRELSPRFEALACHYAFEPSFARPGEGHDKGGVEARGKGIRLRYLTPIPHGASLDEIAAQVLGRLNEHAETGTCRGRGPIQPRFAEEQNRFLPLPVHDFEARRVETCTVNRSGRILVEGAWYSVDSRLKHHEATVLVGPAAVEIRCKGEQYTYDRKGFGETSVRYVHYLTELARKPQATRQVMPDLLAELGAPFDDLWRLLVDGGCQGSCRLRLGHAA